MRIKKILAAVMALTLVVGSSVTVFAEGETGATGATGTGAQTGHLDTDVVSYSFPTSESVANIFNFTIDPENILANADKFTDNTTAAGSSFANEDLVYFAQASGATPAFASSSQSVDLTAKNYVAANVTVEASIGEAASGKTIIPLAASAEALAAATEPTLLLTLKVGDQSGVVTADGVTVSKEIAGQTTKFDTKWNNTSGKYELAEKDNQTWDKAAVQLTGKVKGGTVEDTLVAPTVTLTWSVTKKTSTYLVTYNANHGSTPATATESVANGSSPTGNTEAVNALKTGYEGYTFAGWFDAAGEDANEVTVTSLTSATTVYAHWTENPTPVNAASVSGTTVFVKLLADSSSVTSSTVTSITVDGQAITSYNVSATGIISFTAAAGQHTVLVTNGGTVYTATVTVG